MKLAIYFAVHPFGLIQGEPQRSRDEWRICPRRARKVITERSIPGWTP
jgi:hypothetical protein